MMSLLTSVVTSRYPTTNNHLKNSSNPRQQATINDGRVTLQPVQGRQTTFAAEEGHMSKQCTKPKRKQDDSWFKDKVLLVQAQANGQILHEEELAFLADLEIPEGQATQTIITHNDAYQADNLDAYDSNCDELNTIKVLMSPEQSSVVNHSETEITSDSNIIPYSHVNDTLTTELEGYKEQVKVLKEGKNVKNTCAIVILDSEETLMLAEESRLKMILKQQDPMVLEKKDNSVSNQSTSSFDQYFELNELKAQLQEKGKVISKLKERIKSLSALRDELRNLKGKAIVDTTVTTHTIHPEMLKVDVKPIAPRLLNNRTIHSDYLRLTQEQATIVREVVEQDKS
nr:hypothetical protein [Tanacetum cinerariifolium]